MTARRVLSEQQHHWLAGELSAWRNLALVSADQIGAIESIYETASDRHDRRRTWLLYTLSGLAVVLFGAAALLLVGYNWQALPAALKLAIVFGAVIGTYALGLELRFRHNLRWASEAVVLLGCLLYGAGIWLVAQVFHMSAHYPDGVFWWAVGVLPLAILLDSLALHALMVALLALWCGMEMIGFFHLGGWLFGRRWHFLPNGCYLALLMALPGLVLAYRGRSVWRVALYVPLLVWWTLLQPLAWHWYGNPVYFIGAVGALLIVIAESHRAGSLLAVPYRAYGVLLFGAALVPLSYWDFHRFSGEFGTVGSVATMTGVILAIGAAAFCLAQWLRYRYLEQGHAELARRVDEIRRRQWLPLGMVALMVALSLWSVIRHGQYHNYPEDFALVPTLAANAALVGLSVWLMWVGLREDRGLPFAAGVGLFLFWAVIRYVDLFGRLGGMLGAALLFFLCGCGLLGVVAFWRKRKKVQYV